MAESWAGPILMNEVWKGPSRTPWCGSSPGARGEATARSSAAAGRRGRPSAPIASPLSPRAVGGVVGSLVKFPEPLPAAHQRDRGCRPAYANGASIGLEWSTAGPPRPRPGLCCYRTANYRSSARARVPDTAGGGTRSAVQPRRARRAPTWSSSSRLVPARGAPLPPTAASPTALRLPLGRPAPAWASQPANRRPSSRCVAVRGARPGLGRRSRRAGSRNRSSRARPARLRPAGPRDGVQRGRRAETWPPSRSARCTLCNAEACCCPKRAARWSPVELSRASPHAPLVITLSLSHTPRYDDKQA